ncbi:DUF1847 domain-containing protein [Lacrimispora sp.]|uniref:DUF1847 domain-containing protein n=1 Tax=Lacrimispora sp. TaxID=2719234 RepID=UPI00289714F6|nr:DUF1847 domain-containing protein [Lacrimispora sp.]
MYFCASCNIHACSNGDFSKAPQNCPSLDNQMENISSLYKEDENYKIAQASAFVVSEDYGNKTRLEETMDFAKLCAYKNIGLAFCIGLTNEAEILRRVLTHNNFTVNSILCKTGHLSRELIGIHDNPVAMCNPIAQAQLLNKAKTDLNIVLGLCVGHDSLFIKYSNAPVTVFAVKDRVLCHNPLGAIYQAEAYYHDKLFPSKEQ